MGRLWRYGPNLVKPGLPHALQSTERPPNDVVVIGGGGADQSLQTLSQPSKRALDGIQGPLACVASFIVHKRAQHVVVEKCYAQSPARCHGFRKKRGKVR
jgi:hypothetical protein